MTNATDRRQIVELVNEARVITPFLIAVGSRII